LLFWNSRFGPSGAACQHFARHFTRIYVLTAPDRYSLRCEIRLAWRQGNPYLPGDHFLRRAGSVQGR